MSMAMSAVGFRPPDDKWKQMREAYEACERAGLDIPVEVEEFFNYRPPDASGLEVRLSNYPEDHECLTKWREESSEGLEIDIARLPKHITKIRFMCTW